MLARRGIKPEDCLRGIFENELAEIIDIGTKPDDLVDRVRVFSKYKGIKFSAGLWPSLDAILNRRAMVETLEKQILSVDRSLLVAIGECGMDHYRNNPNENLDQGAEAELLELQLDLARRYKLPVIIHSRDAARETAEILSRHPDITGVIHCFSYDIKEAKAFIDMGYYISFAGNLTYKNARLLQEALTVVPDDKLLFETDSPFLAPVPFRGKTANPAMVTGTYRFAADLRKCPLEDMAVQVMQNAAKLFSPHWIST